MGCQVEALSHLRWYKTSSISLAYLDTKEGKRLFLGSDQVQVSSIGPRASDTKDGSEDLPRIISYHPSTSEFDQFCLNSAS
jgi:hypothetical protein